MKTPNVTPFNRDKSEPADITTASALGQQLAAFNAGTDSRADLRHEDRAGIAKIRQCTAILREQRPGATKLGADLEREQARELVEAVTRYLLLIESPQSVTVGTEQIETMAIESAAIRSHSHRVGVEIVTGLESYIEARRAAIARQEEGQRAEDEALDEARKLPMLGQLISIFEQLYSGMDVNPDDFSFRHTINEVPAFMHELMKVPTIAAKLPKGVTALSLIETLQRHKKDEQRAAA